MSFGFNNCNNFGIGMMPGTNMGLMPGSSVKITQTTTGSPSVFTGRNFYQGGGFGSSSTSVNVQYGPSGFWGGALGFLQGLGGRCMSGWNNMCSNFMGGWGMNNGYNMSGLQYPMPNFAQGINLGTGTTGLNSNSSNSLLTNLEKMGTQKGWTIVQNPDGSFWANLPANKAADGKQIEVKGDYNTVMDKIVKSEGKTSSSTSASSSTTDT